MSTPHEDHHVHRDEDRDEGSRGAPPPGPAPRGTVLVVDDAPTVRLYHRGVLRDAGFAVEEAADGAEALELLLERRYELVVTDVTMPRLDGHGLVRRLRAEAADPTTPVLTVGTGSLDADAEAAHAAGANLHLVKPVAPELLARVAELLTGPLPAPSTPGSRP